MLEPHDRMLLVDLLRPPSGYGLDEAIGTTFTTDLLALLTCPLSFAMFDWQDDHGRPAMDPHALLEALRRYAGHMTVFCQAGYMAVPKPDQPLYAYLEDSVIECRPPRPGHIFHPKLWVLRFAGLEEDAPVRYRVICQSRNLTFDRSWDTAAVLEGNLRDRERAISANRPLADLVAALPGLAVRGIPPERRARIELLADELRRVRFETPEGFDAYRFWPLGISGHRRWPFGERIRRMLVVSPFLQEGILRRLGAQGEGNILVSSLESLQAMPRAALDNYDRPWVLKDSADPAAREEADEEHEQIQLRGLHAKVYVADDGWSAHVWTGSANATDAAFGGNVELLVQLTGKKSFCGVDAILKPTEKAAGLRALLVPFDPPDEPVVDEKQEALDRRIDDARVAIASADLLGRVEGASDDDRVALRLEGAGRLLVPEGIEIRCWPIRLGAGHAARITSPTGLLAAFPGMEVESLTSFFAFHVTASAEGRRGEARFTINVPLHGAPANRRDRILASMLSDRESLLRFLLLLLADATSADAGDELHGLLASVAGGRAPGSRDGDTPLLEALMRTLARDPDRLDHVARLLKSLEAVTDGRRRLPDGFDDIWTPIWEARNRP